MPKVRDTSTLDSFRQRLGQTRSSAPLQGEVVRAVNRMLERLVLEERTPDIDSGTLVSTFNALLQQVKDQFRASDTLRLIEPLGCEASVALVAVRLSIVKRTIDAELARSTEQAS